MAYALDDGKDRGDSVTLNGRFVPAGTSYDARLKVYPETGGPFEIKPARGWFGNLKEEGFEALQRVNSALSSMTFDFRVERYEKQLRDRGAFHMCSDLGPSTSAPATIEKSQT